MTLPRQPYTIEVPMRVIGLAVVLTLSLTLAPLAAEAQPAGKTYRIGFLANVPPTTPQVARNWDGLTQGLREHGYVEGKNLQIERRYAEGRPERWPELASELVRLKVDLIVVNTTPAAVAAKKATSTIPIVFVGAIDPVGAGIAASLARPGGNVTGVALLLPEMSAKGLSLLKEAVPGLARVAVLWNAANPGNVSVWRETEVVARALSLVLHSQPVRTPDDFEGAFTALARERLDGLLILGDVLMFQQRKLIVDFATQKRLPTTAPFRELADIGCLMSYGPDVAEAFRGSAKHVDRILKGAKPGDLPFEQATKFELVINLKTAKVLGLTIPQSILVRADQVIE